MKSKYAPLKLAALAFISILTCSTLRAQTPQLQYTFEDGPGTTTTSSGALPVVLNMLSNGAPVDLHGAANTGVQNQGHSLNISQNPISGNSGVQAYAVTTGNATLAQLGVVSNFTATVWFKITGLITNLVGNPTRFFVLGTNGANDINSTLPNVLGMEIASPNVTTPFPRNEIWMQMNTLPSVTAPIYYDLPTNEWLFVAMTYDSVSGIASIYFGSEASPAKLYVAKTVGAGINFNLSGSASLSIGNRPTGGRDFPGSIDDFRFYTTTVDANFVENIRQSATPLLVTNLRPDGSILQGGTNRLTFTASSANGINTNNIRVLVNGTDVSTNLSFSGPSTAVSVTYTNLPVNPTLISQSLLDGVNVAIRIVDNAGIIATNSFTYDAFSSTNVTIEAEDFDFGGGLFIDNPVVSFVGPDTNTYYQEQTPYQSLIDVNENGGGTLRIYRDPTFPVETEYSLGGLGSGPISVELMRQKVLDAYAVTNIANEVNVGFFDGGTGPGLPNWMNYTRTFPTGNYNVYMRFADGAGNLSAALDQVTGGWGTQSQTTTNLGTFTMAGSGGWDMFSWVPLRDSSGNLVRVQLSGTNTLRLTAGTAGGGNINFFMLTPANTNLPTINNLYPNGTNMFQPAAALTFVANSAIGVAINTNAVKVRFTVTNLLGQGFVTNLTATNGLTFSGPATNLTVSAALLTNEFYTAAINIADANGTPAASAVTFDTLNPAYTWEGPDYDYGGGLFVPDPVPVDGYLNLSGQSGVDFNYANTPPFNNYRDGSIVGVEGGTGDFPLRLQYLTNSPVPAAYDLGYFNGGNWLNYTRNFPAGLYNIFVRAADGSTGGAVGNVGISVVSGGWGQPGQTTTNLGAFNIPVTGGWQTYVWVPLRDSSGNLVKFNGGGTTNTLRATSAGSQNVFFYALFPANTNLPLLSGVSPVSGSQLTNTFSFGVQSTVGVSSNSVVVTVNGITVSNLVFSGTINNWTVKYPHLAPNTPYVITVTVTDLNGNSSTTTASFDTINPGNYTWEAEDYDHDGGLFFDNPQTNAYAGLGAIAGVDTVQTNFGGSYSYRTSGEDNGPSGDIPRPQYQDVNNPQVDGSIGFFSDGAWCNYTRNYPAGTYNVFGRFATASPGTDANLAQITSGWGTLQQTSNVLGSFAIPNTGGWSTYAYVPLRDASGNLATVTFNGSTNTLQLIRPYDTPTSPDVNVNFLMLAPALTAKASLVGTNVIVAFPTVTNFNYLVQYKTNLNDPAWILLGTVGGNNGLQSVTDPVKTGTRFYRVQIQ